MDTVVFSVKVISPLLWFLMVLIYGKTMSALTYIDKNSIFIQRNNYFIYKNSLIIYFNAILCHFNFVNS